MRRDPLASPRRSLMLGLLLGSSLTVSSASAQDSPAQEEPAQDKPAQDKPAQDKPAQDKPAAAQGYGGPTPPAVSANKTPHALPPGQKRTPQDFDGREDVTSVGEDALWIPRVLFFPAYLVAEYLVRAPLGAITVAVEENDVISEVLGLFTFGPDNNISVVPTGFVDFGLRPSIGIFFGYDDFITEDNDLRASFGFGGYRFWKLSVADRIPLVHSVGTERARSYIQVESDFLTRADLSYWGIGPRAKDEDESAYSITTYGGGGRVHVEPWRGTFFEGWVTGRYNVSGAGECAEAEALVEPEIDGIIARGCDPPTIRRRLLDGEIEPPASYGRPYRAVKSGMLVVLDSRPERPEPGTGVALEIRGEQAIDLDEPRLGQWFTYGGSLAGFLDLTGTQRVLSLTLAAHFLDPVGEYEVPFTELLGVKRNEDVPDSELMRGFRPGRLLGNSATAATLEYRWPIWAFLDGTLQTAVGNTFAESHLEDFDFEHLRFSFVGGIRSPNHRDHSFNLLAGFGTETFADGAAPTSLRFLFGGTTGF